MKRAAAYWPFGALFVFFFWPYLTLEKSFVRGDYSVQHLPWALQAFEAVRGGVLPLWTNAMACGFPLFAEGQSAALYFPNWLAYRFLPFITGYTWSVPLHFLIGAAGMYAYVRRLRLSREASVIAATCFCFSSAYAGCFYNAGSLRTLCWLPVMLYALERMRGGGARASGLCFLALVLLVSQQWLAGFAQLALYSFGFLLAHEMLAFAEHRRRAPLLLLCGALFLGTMVAWPQIAPTLELIGQSVRKGESASFALWGSVPPFAAVSLLFPEWGQALRVQFYVGMMPLFLILFLFFTRREKGATRHVWLAILFFLLALGKFNPAYRWVVETFSFTTMRNPMKFIFFTTASLSVLAAFGYEAAVSAALTGRSKKRFERFLAAAAGVILALPLAAQGALRAFEPYKEKFSASYVSNLMAEKGSEAKDVSYYAGALEGFFGSLKRLFSYQNELNLTSAALVVVSAALLLLLIRKSLSPRKFFALASLVLVLDLAAFGSRLGVGFPGNDGPAQRTEPHSNMKIVMCHAEERPGLLAEPVRDPANELFPPNSGMSYGVEHAGGYSPLLLKNYYDLVRDLGIADSSLGRPLFSEEVWRAQRGILDLVGARYLHSDQPLDWPGLRRLESSENFYFYENERALPEVSARSRWRVIADPKERLAYMKSLAFSPAREAVLAADIPLEPSEEEAAPGSFELSAWGRPDELLFHAKMARDALVRVRLAAYPGWKLKIDGRPSKWIFVDHAFLGFVLKEGEHEIALSYYPSSWPLAWWISAAGSALSLLAGAVIAGFPRKVFASLKAR